jgi:serine/threonine protein kinase
MATTESAISGSPEDPWASLPALVEAARAGGWLIDAAELEVGAPKAGASAGAPNAADPADGASDAVGTVLGKGSSGEITLARWRGTLVAAKRVRVDTPSRATSFLREVRALARTRHPHVLPFYGACLSPPDDCWIVARACRGGTLKQWLYPRGDPDDIPPVVRAIRGSGVPPLAQRLAVARQVAGAMCYLQTGTPRLAHRDLKPGNVFVLDAKAASQPAGTENASASGSEGIRRRGEAGSVAPSPSRPDTDAGTSDPALAGDFEDAPIVVVADFGLARDEEEASTPEPPSENGDGENGDPSPPSGDPDWTGETGTYLYMAPEVVRHESYDASCDVWSFGVMLDELIAGAPPYRSQRRDAAMSPSQIAVGVADGAVAFETAADAPPGLAAIVRKCVERDPKDRPSFAEVCDALDAMLPSVLRDLEEKEKEASRNSLKNQLGVAFRNVVAFVEETASTVRESLDIRDPDSVDAFEETEVEASTVSLDAFLAKPRGGEAGANAEGGEAK